VSLTDRCPAPPDGAHAGDDTTGPAAASTGAAAASPWADPFALAARAVPGLDGLRGLACLMIFNVHFFAQFADASYFTAPGSALHSLIHAFHSGSHGVDVFFVVSGFLIYGSLARKRPTLARFLLERYKRLLPVVLVVNIPALYWVNADWKMIADNVLFLNLFGARLVTFVSWALIYEMYFYLLCGAWLIVLGCGRDGPPWRSWALITGLYVANSLYFHVNPILSDWRFVGFFVGLGLGMLKADPRGSRLFAKIPPAFQPVGLAALGLACWLWSRDFTGTLSAVSPALALGYFILFDLVAALLVASLANAAQSGKGGSGGGLLAWTPLRVVGAVSYSLFLLHTQWGLPLANALFGRPGSLPGLWLHYGLSLGVSLALAAFLYLHLEKFYFTRR
jgi:peptidoglycan/LPS O-acetylase OafA/YrhL